MRKENLYHSLYVLFLNLAIISTALFALSSLEIIKLPNFLSNNLLFGLLVLFSGLSILNKSKLNELRYSHSSFIKTIFEISPYFFLSLLIVLAINQFIDLSIISNRIFHISAISIFFGFFSFYSNRDRIEKELEDEKQKEDDLEKERYQDFEHKFPRLNRIWGLKYIVRWMYKEGWVYSISLFVIISIGLYLRINSLSSLSLWHDEALSVLIADQITKHQIPVFLTGEFYLRAIPYHYLLSLFLLISDNINLYSRLVNVPFFIISSIMIYLIPKNILKLRIVGLFSVILFSISSFSISMFREARFYEFYAAIYLLFLYILFSLFVKIINSNSQTNIFRIISKFKSYLILLTILGVLLLTTSWGFSYILYSFFFCSIGLSIFDRPRTKFWILIGILSFVLFTVGIFILNDGVFSPKDYLVQNSVEWKGNLSLRPFGDFSNLIAKYDIYFYILFIFLGFLFTLANKRQILKNYLIFFVFSLAPYIFLENQGFGIYAPRYFYNFFIPIIIIISLTITLVFTNLKIYYGRIIGIIFILVILTPVSINAYNEFNSIEKMNSFVDIKNNNLDDMFKFALENYGEDYEIFADSHTAVAFYIYSGRLPDGMLFEDKRIATLNNKTDMFLNVEYFSVDEITMPDKKIIFLMWYSSGNLEDKIVDKFNKRGKLVYKQNAKRIYLFVP